MAIEIFFEYPNNKYGEGILLQEWNGTYSLVAAQKSQNGGTVYKKWVAPIGRDKKPIDKQLPWRIDLGDSREQALETLRYFGKVLSAPPEPDFIEDDMPF